MNFKILILGHGRHGKDTVAEILQTKLGLKFQSSSMAALDAIFPALDAVMGYRSPGISLNKAKQFAFRDRHSKRRLWKALITLYNSPDKTALCRKILEESDIYVGMRCNEEYEACKHLFHKIFYVDASKRVSKKDPTMKIPYVASEMVKLNNNGDEASLELEVQSKVVDYFKWLESGDYC